MRISAFTPARDFSQPDPSEVEEEIIDDRLDPDEVAILIDRATEAAKKEAYHEGYTAGVAEERATIASRLEEEVQALRAEIDAVRVNEEELFEDLATRTSRLMLALVHQLARRLGESEAQRLAENVTMRAVEAVRGKHRITIRADESLITPLRAVLRLPTDEEAASYRIVFEPQPDGSGSQLEVAWLTGKVTFDPYAFTDAIDEVFTETLKNLDGDGGALPLEGESS
ncbi:MAG: hypothetical protein HRU11_11075 [Parvularculaceae bacterium]|nr:hypothetical protein [Parvularculaceae bacterium]